MKIYKNPSLYPTIHQTKGWNNALILILVHYMIVFILQSIKPRVETCGDPAPCGGIFKSLSYNPSNQGLKHWIIGMLHSDAKPSLSYNPSNQGLKQPVMKLAYLILAVFILQSIKPRVET